MMLSPSPSTIARSSLEEMLDSLRRRDEIDKPKDAPPALPSRPTSKARTPPVGRALPVNFRVNVDGSSGCSINGFNGREDVMRKENGLGNFAFKRLNGDQDEESPYMLASENENGDRVNGSNLRGSYWEDNIGYFLQKKLHVWCQLPNGQWELGTIQSSTGAEASVMLSNKKVIKISTVDLLPANPDIVEGVDDLVQLGFLNEPSVLHSLHRRFSQDKIYSNAGSVLIAVNPLKDIKQYGKEFIEAYRQRVINNPHVYATTDAAYSGMLRDEVNQSIIISGESGAGKTETAKAVLEYLTSLGGVSGIDDRISRANVILEAFGNAKTSRNNNASRFGKLIEILFSRTGKICGAVIQTFLLDKSRVVHLVNGERSFHVFYQLCAGLPSRLKEKFNIRAASEYSYLNHSECLVIGGVDDARKFNILVEAFDTLQFTKEDQEHAFGLLAAVLWIGNITFQIIDSENNHVEVIANEAVANAAKLMGCSFNELKLVLSTHKEQSGKDSIAKKSTLQQATDARDSLAKFIYASLFDWLVEQINKSLQPGREYSGRSINILDIYGFESFKKNGFEQFCINYANERLQQHFIRHLFKLQQEDYEFNGVDGMKVNFEDNQECLNLIEKKPLGVLALMDEELSFPKATDLTFANKLKQHFKSHPRFKGERGRAFGVRHYAGEVVYDTNGFLEKNRDLLHSDSIQLFSSCASKLLKIFASKMVNHSYKPAGSISSTKGVESREPGVGTKYKALLFELFHKLECTSHHFICCMRPNRSQVCGLFEEDLVRQQLRYCGILEVIRISRSGYPIRITHKEFAGRYEFFLEESGVARDPLSISIAVLQHFNVHPEMYHVGYTKLLFRTGQIRAALEERRTQAMQSILGVQKHFRGCHSRGHFHELKHAATILQSFIRGESSRRRSTGKVKRFSFTVRAFNVPSKVYEQQAIIRLQSVIRGSLVRNHFMGKSDLNRFENQPNRGRRLSEDHALPATLTGLQKRVLEAEATIGKKEEENAALRDQVKQFEARRLEYEAKMKSMEDMWQKQMASLQTSLAAAKKSLAAENVAGRAGNSPPHYYDSEDTTSMESRTPRETGAGREMNGTSFAVNNLVKEFEQQKNAFDDDAKGLAEAKSGQGQTGGANTNPDEEYRKIKVRFETWKKEYKAKLRENKPKVHKHGPFEADIIRRKWWGKLRLRSS
ncbi:myosin-2-like [Cucurbita maxima]|uniref:Myosin-2-like n=1 Tax=Cucurbita maxima TaxID=3661 RepID=A0A6J1IWC3_CUCMA|nr:myosin-2-like [Cucurbita maxima]